MAVAFDHARFERDAALQGLSGARLARKAGVSQQTVARFFKGSNILPPTAQKLADALEKPLSRYLVDQPTEEAMSR